MSILKNALTSVQEINMFYSPQQHDNRLEFSSIDGYNRYDYALFESTGHRMGLFDFMRYDRAFLARYSDVTSLVDFALESYIRSGSFLVCAYGWGNKCHWTEPRLMSHQQLTLLKSHEVYEYDSDFTAMKPPKKLKVRSDIVVSGSLKAVLEIMYNNQALPNTESDAHALERMLDTPEESQSIGLTTFFSKEQEWKL